MPRIGLWGRPQETEESEPAKQGQLRLFGLRSDQLRDLRQDLSETHDAKTGQKSEFAALNTAYLCLQQIRRPSND